MWSISSVALALAIPALAVPNTRHKCNISKAKMPIPSSQTALVQQTSAPSFVSVGVGVQNYTCNATSLTYSNVGAVAELFDISCLFGTSSFTTIQDEAFNIWQKAPSSVTVLEAIKLLGGNQLILGQHYFVPNPKPAAGSPAISPKWDFTSAADKGNANAFVIGAKVGDLPAPTGKTDVDWLQVKNVEGALADTVYRVYTKGGQPPSSCTAGAPLLTVKYTSQYWLFGGSIQK